MKRNVFLLIFLSLACLVNAQNQTIEQCGHTAYLDYLETIDPGINEQIEKAHLYSLAMSNIKSKADERDTIYTINVVFHVVYNNQSENISDALLQSQMEVLNETFRRRNADTVNTRDVFKPVAQDTRIQFKFADTDPNGNATNGIVRTATSRTTFLPTFDLSVADQVKGSQFGSPAWDTDKYLNVWICDLSFQNNDLLYGYAYPPTNAPNWGSNSFVSSDRQGVVVYYKVVGRDNPLAPNFSTGSKTMVHEVGHYLGLRHIWGDAPGGGNCLLVFDDGLEDTPLSGNASSGCNPNKNTCNAETPNLPDQVENYMDYSSEVCQNMFTQDQSELMRNNIRNFRPGIVEKEYPLPVYENTDLFPNPAIGLLNITIGGVDAAKNYSLRFTNMLGQVVGHYQLQSENFQKIEVDLGFRGAYYYEIIEGSETILKEDKIVFIN